MPKPETLGMRLAQERREKAARERRDIDGKDVAAAVGISPPTYSRYEADLTKPDDETLGKLSAFFGVTRSWLRFGEGQRELPSTTEQERPRPTSSRPASASAVAGARRPRKP